MENQIICWGNIGIMENQIIYWGYIGIMENQIIYWGYIGIMENQIIYWGYIRIMENQIVYWGNIGKIEKLDGDYYNPRICMEISLQDEVWLNAGKKLGLLVAHSDLMKPELLPFKSAC